MNVLVYGWYHKNNIGDDLFIAAFKCLFPNFNFTFVDKFTISEINQVDAIFIGGGSFLYAGLQAESGALDLLKTKKVFYIGVGSETDIHPHHLQLLTRAKVVAIRNTTNLSKFKFLNQNTIVIPDIVFSLRSQFSQAKKIDKSVLIIPNCTLVPQNSDPNWKFASWNYFTSEFSQFLDILIVEGYHLNFLPMCDNQHASDTWAAVEIVNRMIYKNSDYFLRNVSIHDIGHIMSQFKFVITQRFHGMILSEILEIPYLTIHHHDKLKGNNNVGAFLPYYGLNKQSLLDIFKATNNSKLDVINISDDSFEELKKQVLSNL